MEHCQQTFHWNHIKPLLFPHFCTLTLSIAPCLFISLILNPLLPLSVCFCPPSFSLPPHPSHPLGLLAFFSWGSDSFFKPVCLLLSARTWQHRANLLMPPCQRFGMWSSYSWELRCALDAETSQEIIHFIQFGSEDIFLPRRGKILQPYIVREIKPSFNYDFYSESTCTLKRPHVGANTAVFHTGWSWKESLITACGQIENLWSIKYWKWVELKHSSISH